MQLSLADAAKLAGLSKSTLFKAVKRGAVSGVRDALTGEWRIDVCELERVYPLPSPSQPDAGNAERDHAQVQNPFEPWNAERRHYEARITALESERDYLRQALQAESDERRQLVRLLTAPQPSAETSPLPLRTGWVWPVVALVAVAVAVALGWMRK